MRGCEKIDWSGSARWWMVCIVCEVVFVDRFMNERPGRGKAYVPTECEHIANICTHGVSLQIYITVFGSHIRRVV